MATGAEFFAQLEKRFNQLPAEEKLDKIVFVLFDDESLEIYRGLLGK